MNKFIGIILSGFLLSACSGDNGQHQHQEQAGRPTPGAAHLDRPQTNQSDTEIPANVGTAFDEVLDAYLKLSDALVEGDAVESAEQGDKLHSEAGKLLKTTSDQQLSSEMRQPGAQIIAGSAVISRENDVEKQRAAFVELSDAMITMVEKLGHQKESLYHQRCPMVNGGNGDWLSTRERIMNPYHGNRMLHCGSTIRTL